MARPDLSAPLFLVDDLPAEGSSYTLGGPEGHHAATVARLRPGETLLLCDGWGGTAEAEVILTVKGALTVRVGARSYEPAPNPRLVVAQGIPKGDRGELAVQAMTETGVDVIVPWSASRSVSQWRAERGEKSRQRWIDTAREATKQSRRSWLASVAPAASSKELTGRIATADLALVLHEEATDRLAIVDLPVAGEILLVIGPEGGVGAEELAQFAAAGAHAVRLGREVLRTSTAGVAALSVLAARLGRW